MGNHRFYTPSGIMIGPVGWAVRFCGLAALSFIAYKWDEFEDIQEQGPMRDNTFLYFKHRTNIAKHDPNRPSFPRILID